MDPEDKAKAIAAAIREFARLTLRENYPDLSEPVLDKMLDKISSVGEDIIEAQPAMAALSKPTNHFFSLPREIRDIIYEEALKSMWGPRLTRYVDRPRDMIQPVLMQVCRQLREEVADVYHGTRLFYTYIPLSQPDSVSFGNRGKLWLELIGQQNSGKIKDFEVEFCRGGKAMDPDSGRPTHRAHARHNAMSVATFAAQELGEPLSRDVSGSPCLRLPTDEHKFMEGLGFAKTGLRASALRVVHMGKDGHVNLIEDANTGISEPSLFG